MAKHRLFAVTLVLAACISIDAFGGEWKKGADERWWYQYDDGGYPSSKWLEVDGKHYYFGPDGYMLANTITPDGYLVGADGAWVDGTNVKSTDARGESQHSSHNESDSASKGRESHAPTTGERNAVEKAKSYLEIIAFSRKGLIEQLEYEKFLHEEAVYGADNCGADWNEQVAKKAKSYLELMAFSRGGLIEQLEYEGFTHEQAVYGVKQNGY